MSSGSRNAVAIPADSVTYIARRASPTARKTPENAMPTASGTLAGMLIAMNFEATSAGSPWACRSVVSAQSRKTNIAAAIAAEKIAVMTSAEAASRRARGRSPAPSARETVAEAAMVRPMLIDMAKKVVKPT